METRFSCFLSFFAEFEMMERCTAISQPAGSLLSQATAFGTQVMGPLL